MRKGVVVDISIKGLTRYYGSKPALDGIDLDIGEGMFGLLGPNGAGKTTLMRIIATVLEKSGGSVKVGGIDISQKKKIRSILGYLPQEFSMYPSMSVYEAMDYLSILSGITDGRRRKANILKLLEKVNLDGYAKTKVRALSGGMKRRLGIAQALINDPAILIVDEPTAGLDPEERIRFRNLLGEFSAGRVVILSTHIAADIENSCRDLAILDKGRIRYRGSVSGLLERAAGKVWMVKVDPKELSTVNIKYSVISTVNEEDSVKVRIIANESPSQNAVAVKPTLEDAYMYVMKKGEE